MKWGRRRERKSVEKGESEREGGRGRKGGRRGVRRKTLRPAGGSREAKVETTLAKH